MTPRKLPTSLLLTALLAFPASAKVRKAPDSFDAVITHEADGDTLFIVPMIGERTQGPEIKTRLRYADTPEVAHNANEQDQPGGRNALAYVKAHWENKTVSVTQHGVSYGRPVVDVVAKDDGTSLSLALVSQGFAMVDVRFHPPKSFLAAQDEAKKKRIGIWADNPTPPWEFRKQQRDRNRSK